MFASLAYLFYKASTEGETPQLKSASQKANAACDEIRAKFTRGLVNQSFSRDKEAGFQNALLEIILERYDGVEGGFWSKAKSFESYAFPTYDGASPKIDVPRSEMEALSRISAKAVAEGKTQETLWKGRREAMISVACPVQSENYVGAVWILARVPYLSGEEFDQLKYFVLALLVFVAVQGVASLWLLYNWAYDLKKLKQAIYEYKIENLSGIEASREPDLQPLVLAFNDMNSRLKSYHDTSAELSRKLSQAERLTLLGRMAAGIAHEIRNPLATIKLKLENVAVRPGDRFSPALPVFLEQIERVDRLIQMLLAMTRPLDLHLKDVELRSWFDQSFPSVFIAAAARGVTISARIEVPSWRFDAFHLGRALENVLHNAIAYAPENSEVKVTMASSGNRLSIEVRDHGPGIPENDRPHLFEPFVTQRVDGTGLGLVLAKEITEAHGGHISEIGNHEGACFRLEIPWPKS